MSTAELRDPASQVTHLVEGLLAELHGRSRNVRLGDDLERNLGLGSLERAELIVRLENAFSLNLPESSLVEARTAGDLLNSVLAARGGGAAAGLAVDPTARAEIDRSPAWRVPGANEVRTLAEVARYRAETDGDKLHVRFLGEGGEEKTLTYAGLWDRALKVAEGLASRGIKPGDRVALVLPTGEDFFPAFLGIQCAAAVPVPIYPPIRLDQLGAYLDRHTKILADAGTSLVLSDEQLRGVSKLLRDRVPGLRRALEVSSLETGDGLGSARVQPGDLGFIQYTSGSTGHPKGVALTHDNLLANMRCIGKGLGLGPEDVAISWVPLYHDMGLVGCWMTALLYATPVVMMSPLSFLSRPERWLWAIHRHRGTVAPSPNFGYELCARRIRDETIEGLDLSRWRLAINGAETVLPQTVERFCDRFRPYGFKRRAMFPVYGLAETCLGLTVPPRDRGPRYDVVDGERLRRERRALPAVENLAEGGAATTTCVSVGSPLDTQEIRIVDVERPEEEVPERTEGRILMSGPSVMEGYFQQPEATAAVRVGEWTDTGDLGYLADGEVFITGRIKDVVIYAGRNYHPQDLEQAAASVEGIRKGCVIAFDAPAEKVTSDAAGAGEAIVVVAETREPRTRFSELEERVEAAVLEATGAPVDSVVLVPPGTVLKTSSGKLRRRETREHYLGGALRQAKEPWWVLLRITLRSLWARGRAAAAGALRGLYSFYASTVIAVGASLAFLWIGFASRNRASAVVFARRSLRLIFAAAGIPVRRLGPSLPEGPAIVVSNHGSFLDGLFLTLALERPLNFTAKKDLFSWPLVGRGLKRLGYLQIDRSDGASFVKSFAQAIAAAEAGELLHFFPEGTFTTAAGVRPFRLGAFQLAAEKRLPVVPVALRGARAVLPDKSVRVRWSRVEVEVLPALEPPAEATLRAIAEIRNRAREALVRGSGEPALDIVSAALPGEESS